MLNQEKIPDKNLPIYLQKYTVDIFDDKQTKSGSILYTTVGAIPSNVNEQRVWELNLTGYLRPNIDKYCILYDFRDVDYEGKNIGFENILSGTFNICGQVLDASKVLNYRYSDEKSTLTIEIYTKKWGFQIKKLVNFSYCINVDDSSCSTLSYKSSAIEVQNGSCVNTSISDVENSTVSYKIEIKFNPEPPSPSATITMKVSIDTSNFINFTVNAGDSTCKTITGLEKYTQNNIETETFEFSNNNITNEIEMKFTNFTRPSTD